MVATEKKASAEVARELSSELASAREMLAGLLQVSRFLPLVLVMLA